MKKFVALFLALILALSATAAFAASSSGGDNKTTVTAGTGGNATVEAVTVVWQIPTTDALKAILEALTALDGEGKAASYFPEELALDENLVVAEAVSLDCLDNAADYAPYSFEMTTTTAIAKDTAAKALIGTAKDGETAWAAVDAAVPADNTIAMTLNAEQLGTMAAAGDIALIVLVPAAE